MKNKYKVIFGGYVLILLLSLLSFYSIPAETKFVNDGIEITPTPTQTLITPSISHPLTELAVEFIQEKYGVSEENLLVTNEHQYDYLYLDRSYWFVKI